MDFDCLRKNEDFSASSEAISKIPDATCRKIDALSIFGALIERKFTAMSRHYRGTIFYP